MAGLFSTVCVCIVFSFFVHGLPLQQDQHSNLTANVSSENSGDFELLNAIEKFMSKAADFIKLSETWIDFANKTSPAKRKLVKDYGRRLNDIIEPLRNLKAALEKDHSNIYLRSTEDTTRVLSPSTIVDEGMETLQYAAKLIMNILD
jgi:transketolase